MKPEQYYNARLARGWTLGLNQELKVLQALIRLSHGSLTAQLKRHWQKTKPDMVVSLVPNFNRAMYQALRLARPQIPYVTILTDFADSPPHFWIEPHQAQHLICGTAKAVAQARAAGYDDTAIHATSGMIIRPDFYRDLAIDRRAERCKLQLDPDRPTGIVLFGGHGSKAMRGIAKRLDDTQLILVCGHNFALADELREMSARAPRAVIGFTAHMSYFMHLSDFFIGKPGPGCISEAIQQRLPVIVTRNAWTMPQERYNADWVEENNVGLVLDSFTVHSRRRLRADGPHRRVPRAAWRAFTIARCSKYRTFSSEFWTPTDQRRRAGRRRFRRAFPGRPRPASVLGSTRAARQRSGTAPTVKSAPDSATRRRAPRRRCASSGLRVCGRIAARRLRRRRCRSRIRQCSNRSPGCAASAKEPRSTP